ncbi:MAG: diadenylate cyclase [Planctomycetales bacterium]|nr:diadenylate cyclase [Planctomycetales bacterium]
MAPAAKFPEQLEAFCQLAVRLAEFEEADALLIFLERALDWQRLRDATGSLNVVLAVENDKHCAGATDHGFACVGVSLPESSVQGKLAQALLESVADDLLPPGGCVVALYGGFESGLIDSLSVIRLDEHLGRLTVRDLRQLETRVPLDTLKTAMDLAVEIGREGREGKPVGTLLIVGDHRKVLKHCHPLGYDPVRGYNASERQLDDSKVREAIKEVAQLDGAFVITADGTVSAGCQHISAPAADITLSKGLGARHWAAAAISRATSAIAITVSESNGTVRLFQNGEVMLRVEPFRRAMKWKDFEVDSSSGDG